MPKILMIDDDEDFVTALKLGLSQKGHEVIGSPSGRLVTELINKEMPAVVLLDIRLGNQDGLELLDQIKRHDPHLPVIMLTGVDKVKPAVEAMKKGAFHYLTKPIDHEQLLIILEKAMEQRDLHRQLEEMKQRLGEMKDLEEFMSSSENVQKAVVHGLVRSVSSTDVSVLLIGESGTGKELVAHVIHHLSNRAKGSFVPIDCASIPETLIESELFGHEKGAFTGASTSQAGKLETAHGGTVFLDEVANIPLPIQAKLLRFLERREFERIGGRHPIQANIRVIAATSSDLERMSKEGRFRLDLFYRLNEFPIRLPPLRERKEDIPYLAARFLLQFEQDVGRAVVEIAPEAMEKLLTYDYPGNVRELRNIIKRAMVMAGKRIETAHLPTEVQNCQPATRANDVSRAASTTPSLSLREATRQSAMQVEKQLIVDALNRTAGHQGKAAQLLGITSRTLYNKMKEFGL